jgi:Zn-dependent M28 family amino/carboxypeptidase
MGSARHAAALLAKRVEVIAMLSLEMLGYYSDAPGSQRYPDPQLAERFGTRGDFLAVVGRAQEAALLGKLETAMTAAGPLPIRVFPAPPSTEGVDYSDHVNYWRAGFPAVMVTDTAFLRNPNYHRGSDTAATLDFVRLRQAADAVHDGVVALAKDP